MAFAGDRDLAHAVTALALAAAVACTSRVAPAPPKRLVDLTHPFDASTVYWPTEEGFVLERVFAGTTDGGYYYAANRFRAAEHGGTHIDAPLHFAAGHASVDEIPLEQLVGPAALIDVSQACAADPDHAVGVAELVADEGRNGRIPDGAIVLLRTGWSARWPDRVRYLGTDERGPAAVAKLHFPGLGAEAARWLIEERRVHAVGLDTASIDPGVSKSFDSHRLLFAHDVPAFENLASLDQLPPRGFEVAALPMKIAGGSGGPLRAIAMLPPAEASARR